MQNFIDYVQNHCVKSNEVGVFFLGQAGFIFKTPEGKLIAVDPYLSNCCERLFGFKRLMPYLCEANELVLDDLIISHAHYDHFDPDSVPTLVKNGARLIGAKDVEAECEKAGVKDLITLAEGETADCGYFSVKGVACDHGELAPDALGLVFNICGKKIYYMGDTAFRPDLLDNPELRDVDLLLLPINGAFGNLDAFQAAEVVKTLAPKLAVPCHYWNFAEHGGDPDAFQKRLREIAPEQKFVLMRQGELLTI